MSAFYFLKRRRVGTFSNGRPRYEGPNFRAFLICLLAGKSSVVLNVGAYKGGLGLRGRAIVVNCDFYVKE